MSALAFLSLLPLLALLAWAAAVDVRERRIRNSLTLTLILSGLLRAWMLPGAVTPGMAGLGILAGFGILLPLFVIGALGGGDVKLLAGVGAWLGPVNALLVFAVAAVAGLIIVLAQSISQGRLRVLLRNSAVVAVNLVHLNEVGVEHASATGKSCRSVDRPLPYAVPVLAGVLFVLYFHCRGGLL